MNELMGWLVQEGRESLALTIYVQPKASRDRIAGFHQGALKICLTAPPVDGKANTALIRFLAEVFHLPKSAITLKSGHQGRSKKLLLQGISADAARAALAKHVDLP